MAAPSTKSSRARLINHITRRIALSFDILHPAERSLSSSERDVRWASRSLSKGQKRSLQQKFVFRAIRPSEKTTIKTFAAMRAYDRTVIPLYCHTAIHTAVWEDVHMSSSLHLWCHKIAKQVHRLSVTFWCLNHTLGAFRWL